MLNGWLPCFVFCFLFLTACNQQPANSIETDSLNTLKAAADTMQPATDSVSVISLENDTTCYAYTKDKDTVKMMLIVKDSIATGKLVYKYFEKDRNIGTFSGRFNGDTLLVNYTFFSEGVRSVRQVIFLRKAYVLVEGIGSMKEQYGKMIFTNKDDISFNSNIILEAVDCNAERK